MCVCVCVCVCVVMVSAVTEGSQMDDRMVADAGMKVQDLHGIANFGAVNKQVYMAVRADGTIEKTNTKIAAGMTNSGTAISDSESNSGAANSGTENSDAVNWITQGSKYVITLSLNGFCSNF